MYFPFWQLFCYCGDFYSVFLCKRYDVLNYMGLMQKWHWDLGKKILLLYFLLITTSTKIMFAFLDIYGSFDVQPRDIADIIKTCVVYENIKIQIINNSMAWANFKFPECHYANKSRKTGKKSLISKLLGLKDINSLHTQWKKMVFSVFHVSFFQLNLCMVFEPDVLFWNHTCIGKKLWWFLHMKLSSIN